MTLTRHPASTPGSSANSADGPETRVDLVSADEQTFDPSDYAIGQVISGRFRVESVIGVGSMGVVLAATHLELDERVAIKFIRKEMQQVPGVVQRFAREAKATVSLKSEHIARVFDVGIVEGVGPYIVMELLDGEDLGRVLEREGRLSIRRAVHYVLQACEALAAAHSANIIHRDMKPENLFLTQHGELELIKLLDFGISKATLTGRVFGDELSQTDTTCLLGTPLYMSPEQIQSTDSVDHRTDIWSLGAVLYELVTGESAFVADSVKQVWHRILETDPVPVFQYCPEAPPGLQLVLERCLARDPNNRYQNVAEFAMALLPFAPSRARTYAQRAASILGIKSESIFPAGMPLSIDPRASFQLSGPPPSSLATVTVTQASPENVPVQEPPKPSRSRLSALAPLAGVALVVGFAGLWFGSQSPVIVAAASAISEQLPEVLPSGGASEVGSVSQSRQVRVESEPSGAVVKVGGQVLGLTPLTVLLPTGAQELTIEKSGHKGRDIMLHIEQVAPGAEPLVARVRLNKKQKARSKAKAKPKAKAKSRPKEVKVTRKRRRPARRAERATVRAQARPTPPKVAPTVRRPPVVAPTQPTPSHSVSSVEDNQRPRLLLEEEGRAKILE